jgi:hypothetical protein
VLCPVDATRAVADPDRLALLVRHRAATYEIVGRLDAASAALVAIVQDIDVLTAQPGLYAGLSGG